MFSNTGEKTFISQGSYRQSANYLLTHRQMSTVRQKKYFSKYDLKTYGIRYLYILFYLLVQRT